MKYRRRKTLHETVELNITAFLNLMVILVPFLLITAVFSRMTVLELTLPSATEDGAASDRDIDLQLQMLIYPDEIELRDATIGRIKSFALDEGSVPWQSLVDALIQIKERFPQETAISLLVESSVPYNRLIEVMDHVRSAEVVNVASLEEVELFPSISIGKVPERTDADLDNSLNSLDDVASGARTIDPKEEGP